MSLSIILLLLIPCYVISVAIHELGHAVAGIVNGFKFHLFVIGPLGLKKDNNNKLSIYMEKNPALWGGASITLPRNNSHKNYDAFANVLLAGPICSILFSAAFIVIGITENNIFFALLGFMSLGIGGTCLFPMRNGCFYTDGGRWLRMRRKDQDGRVEMAIWNLTQAYAIDHHFSNINLKETEVLKNDNDLRTKYLGYYFCYNYYKNINDLESAEREKEHITELVQKVPRNFIKLFPVQELTF